MKRLGVASKLKEKKVSPGHHRKHLGGSIDPMISAGLVSDIKVLGESIRELRVLGR